MKLQKVPKFRQLAIEIFVHSIEALLKLFLRLVAHGVVCGVVVYVGEEDGLREGGLDVLS